MFFFIPRLAHYMDQERIPRSLRKPGLMRLSSCFTVSADPYLTSSFLHSGRLTFATIFALQMRNPFGKQQPQINSRFRTISGIIVVHGFRVRTPDSAHNSPASALGGRKIAVFGPNHRGLLRSSHLQNKTSNKPVSNDAERSRRLPELQTTVLPPQK